MASRLTTAHPVQVLLMPAGIIACFRPLTDASLFLILYGAAAVYFSGVMVRCYWHVAYCSPFSVAGAAGVLSNGRPVN